MTPTAGFIAANAPGGRVAFSTNRKPICVPSGDQVTSWIKPFSEVNRRGAAPTLTVSVEFEFTSETKTCGWPGVAQSEVKAIFLLSGDHAMLLSLHERSTCGFELGIEINCVDASLPFSVRRLMRSPVFAAGATQATIRPSGDIAGWSGARVRLRSCSSLVITLCCGDSVSLETACAKTDSCNANTHTAQLVAAMAMARNGEKRNLGVIERYAITSAAGKSEQRVRGPPPGAVASARFL